MHLYSERISVIEWFQSNLLGRYFYFLYKFRVAMNVAASVAMEMI